MQCGGGLSIPDPTNGEGSPPTTNKYARRGDIAFIGGGAILVIGLWIVGGLAYFDTFHTSPPKPDWRWRNPSHWALDCRRVGLFRYLSYLATQTSGGETNTVSGSREAVTPCGRRETGSDSGQTVSSDETGRTGSA